jgi:sugar phosphate isomerase/epimerase
MWRQGFFSEPAMQRRHFLQSLGASAAVGLLARRGNALDLTGVASSARIPRIGLELYAVRHAMKDDPERTLALVRAAGYQDVELLWSLDNFGRTPAQVRDTLKKEGLRAPSAHIAADTIDKDWDKSLETAHLLGMSYIIVPSLPKETTMPLDEWRRWADRFNVAGAAARKANLWLAFHNEPSHMTKVEGQVPYDVFVERLDPKVVRLQLDMGNIAMGGGDPLAYLEKYKARYWSFHVKDVIPDRSKDTGLGTGIVPLGELFKHIPDLAHKPCYVEEEESPDEMAAARANAAYLKALRF